MREQRGLQAGVRASVAKAGTALTMTAHTERTVAPVADNAPAHTTAVPDVAWSSGC